MAVEIATCNFMISGQASLQEDLSLYIPDGTVQIGSAGFAALNFSLENGTGDDQANQMYCERITVPASSAVDLDLCDGTLTNFRGQSITFNSIKQVVVSVVDADGLKRVFIGPQGVAGGAQLWFLGVGADAADEVLYGEIKTNLKYGWSVSVTGGSVVRIYNPEMTSDVSVDVVIVGVDS
jgi:hypothetical protein